MCVRVPVRAVITFRYSGVFQAAEHRSADRYLRRHPAISAHLWRPEFECYARHMIQRRSRMHRTRTGKRLALTDRDLEIFRALQRYRFLRSTYLHAFAGGSSEKRFVERLGDLFHEGYLDRPAQQWRFADARCLPVVYELGKGGRETLMAMDTSSPDPVTWFRDGPHRQFEHSLMVCEVLASIELGMRRRPDLRFIPWPEILAKAPESTRQSDKPYLLSSGNETVIPDAIFGLEYRRDGQNAFRFFALEADRGTMPIARASFRGTSMLTKLVAYQTLLATEIHRSRWGIPNLLVLTVTTNQSRCAELIRQFGQQSGAGPQFLFCAVGPLTSALARPRAELLSEPWARPGLSSLYIDK